MSELATIPVEATEIVPTQPKTMQFFTANPQKLCAAQGKLSAWVSMKISELENERVTLQSELDIALKNKWRAEPWRRQLNLLSKRVDYYIKMRAALDAGYVMVPSMQMDLFAIRTDRDYPKNKHEIYRMNAENSPPTLPPVPLGEGEFVSATADTDGSSYQDTTKNPPRTVESYWPTDFKAVEFPLDVATPAIMSQTGRAMAMKAFDEIGVVRNANQRRGDPFVVARIRDPRQNKSGVCFFIGWYVDAENL